MILKGRAHKYGDNVDTDVIIPARYCTSFKTEDLAPHCLEDLDKEFVHNCKPGDILVAGNNFGCGSSRENAPIAIKGAGVSCVIAKSFARIFYRNSINIGLPILESPSAVDNIKPGDNIEVNIDKGTITNLETGQTFNSTPFPVIIQDIIKLGGMVEFVKSRLQNGNKLKGRVQGTGDR